MRSYELPKRRAPLCTFWGNRKASYTGSKRSLNKFGKFRINRFPLLEMDHFSEGVKNLRVGKWVIYLHLPSNLILPNRAR